MSSSTSSTTPSPGDPAFSSSVETIRGFSSELSIASIDIPGAGTNSRPETPPADSSSRPPSPHSSWPSPSSPSGDSVSSFPSVSSSFLFSSNPQTPPHIDLELATHHATSFRDLEDPHGLIIPSLILPSPLKQSTLHGKALGDVKLLVLSNSHQSSQDVLRVFTDEECDDFVDIGRWEELDIKCSPGEIPPLERPKLMRVSTDWLEHRDAHGLEKYEAAGNIEIIHLPEYSIAHNPADVVLSALRIIHTPFHALHLLLKTDYPPNNLLASLSASSTSPLYTALILSLDSSPTQYEEALIKDLSPHIPLIVLLQSHDVSSAGPSRIRRPVHTSNVRPRSALDLRTSLLRSPEILSTLRVEAADRFLRWREVERSVEFALNPVAGLPNAGKVSKDWKLRSDVCDPARPKSHNDFRWDRARWEADWEGSLSSEVSRTLRQRRSERVPHEARRSMDRRMTVTAKTRPAVSAHPLTPSPTSSPSPLSRSERSVSQGRSTHSSLRGETFARDQYATGNPIISFDPLHLPSIVAFSYSLLPPLRARLVKMFSISVISSSTLSIDKAPGFGVGFLLSAFCAGLGFGFVLAKFKP